MAEEANIQVFVRIRPLNRKEIAENQTIEWEFNDNAMLEETPNGQRAYNYDRCFGEKDNNEFVYKTVGKRLVMKAMEGFNGTVFTYGQTGSGKTWTMRGSESDPGMMKLCIADVFGYVETNRKEARVLIKVSYMEVYNEEINDLLQQGDKGKNLKIVTDDPVKGAIIETLVEEPVSSHEEMMAVLLRGEENRSYASTEMNAESSRSHVIYRLLIEVTNLEDDGVTVSANTRISYLNLVDLAGSERQKSTGASGSTLKEGANINKSLLSLGAVINKLGEAGKPLKKGQKPVFIPYRDSKLTRILKQSLGGNTLTSMLCAVSPAPMYREETVSTLKFGQLCKMIKNSVKSNEIIDEKAQLKMLKAEVAKLKEQLASGGGSFPSADFEEDLNDDSQVTVSMLKGVKVEKDKLQDQINTMNGLLNGKTIDSLLKDVAKNTNERSYWSDWRKENEPRVLALDAERAELVLTMEATELARDKLRDDEEKLERDKNKLHERKIELEEESKKLEEKQLKSENILRLLDEKESELKWQHAVNIRQRAQFDETVHALTRREQLIEDWSRNHKKEKQKLEDHESRIEQSKEGLKDLERRHQTNLCEIKAEEDKLELRRSELDNELEYIKKINKEHIAADATLHARESQCKNRETENELKERHLNSRKREMDDLEILLREKESTNREENKRIQDRDAILRQAEDKINERETQAAFDKQQAIDINERNEEIFRQTQEMNTALKEKEDRLQQLETDLGTKQEELRKNLAEYNTNLERLSMREARMKNLESRELELERNEKSHQEEAASWYDEIAAVSAMHSKEKKRLHADLNQQITTADNFRIENNRLKEEVDKKQADIDMTKAKLVEQSAQINNLKVLHERAQTKAKESADAELNLKGQLKMLQRQRNEEANIISLKAAQLADSGVTSKTGSMHSSRGVTPVPPDAIGEENNSGPSRGRDSSAVMELFTPFAEIEIDPSGLNKESFMGDNKDAEIATYDNDQKEDDNEDDVVDEDSEYEEECDFEVERESAKAKKKGIRRVERLDLNKITVDDLITKEQVIEQIEYTVHLLERVVSRYPAMAPLLQSMDRRHEQMAQQQQRHDELMAQAEDKIRDLSERLEEELARKRQDHAQNALVYDLNGSTKRFSELRSRRKASTETMMKRDSTSAVKNTDVDALPPKGHALEKRRATYAVGEKNLASILAFEQPVPTEVLEEIEVKRRRSSVGGAFNIEVPPDDDSDEEDELMQQQLRKNQDDEEPPPQDDDSEDEREGRFTPDILHDESIESYERRGSERFESIDRGRRESIRTVDDSAGQSALIIDGSTTGRRESIMKDSSGDGSSSKRSSRRVSINLNGLQSQSLSSEEHSTLEQLQQMQQQSQQQSQQQQLRDGRRRDEIEVMGPPKGPETSLMEEENTFQPASFTPLQFSSLGSPAFPAHYGSVLDGFHGRGIVPPAPTHHPNIASHMRQEQIHHMVHKQQMLSQRKLSQQRQLIERRKQREDRRSSGGMSSTHPISPLSTAASPIGAAGQSSPNRQQRKSPVSSPGRTSNVGTVREKEGVQIPVKTIDLTQTLGNKNQQYAHSPEGHIGDKILGIGERKTNHWNLKEIEHRDHYASEF